MTSKIVLVRHGETEWSRDGQHTGRTDIPLTELGREQACLVGPTLKGWTFSHRFSSPLQRARETAEISAVSHDPGALILDDDLLEWDYGKYEGRTNADIVSEEPGWSKWFSDLEGGESAQDVGVRADRAIDRIDAASDDGPVIVFAHGHFLAIMIARWLCLPAVEGRRFVLETATVSVLSMKRDDRVLRILNYGYAPAAPIGPNQVGTIEPNTTH